MDVHEAILKRRSIRRFKQQPISFDILLELINAARLAPSAGNRQPLEYVVIDDKAICQEVFETLSWASYIAPRGTPPVDKRPVAYIAVLINRNKTETQAAHDVGAAAENILLLALKYGLGSCWIRSIDRSRLSQILKVPAYCEIDSVIALGYPDQVSVAEKIKDDSTKYWLDENGILHVPKRELKDILHRNRYSS